MPLLVQIRISPFRKRFPDGEIRVDVYGGKPRQAASGRCRKIMSFWTYIKNIIKRITPPGRNYFQQEFDRNRKDMKELLDQEKKLMARLDKQQKEIRQLRSYIDQELSRRDRWPMLASEAARQAKGRPVWVIKCPAPEGKGKVTWGDYPFAKALQKYLKRSGLYVELDFHQDWNCECYADVVLVLRGTHAYRPDRRKEDCLYIMWNISHPEDVSREEYELYDVICTASKAYADQLGRELTIPVYPLLQCTDTEVFCPDPQAGEDGERTYDHNYLFVGNTRGTDRPCVDWALKHDLPIDVIGKGWEKKYPDQNEHFIARSVENDDLPDLYRRSRVTLNDHWPDMLKYQFINNRIFDALACGLPVISDSCRELEEIFPEALLYYDSEESFLSCCDLIEKDYDSIKARVEAQWPLICSDYSFEARARQLIEIAGRHTTTP